MRTTTIFVKREISQSRREKERDALFNDLITADNNFAERSQREREREREIASDGEKMERRKIQVPEKNFVYNETSRGRVIYNNNKSIFEERYISSKRCLAIKTKKKKNARELNKNSRRGAR